MAKYLLRVQLSVETSRNYTVLRDKLLAVGFTKRIKNKEGVEWRLPNGNYYVESNKTLEEIMNIIRPVILNYDTKAQIVFAEVSGMTWINLEKC